MPRYRKRPIEVEAEQFTGELIPGMHQSEYGGFFVTTKQGRNVMVDLGEWIIQEGDGVHAYPCDPAEFERIYEPCPVPPEPAPAEPEVKP